MNTIHAGRRAAHATSSSLLANAIASTVTEASFGAPATLPLARPRAALCFFAGCAAAAAGVTCRLTDASLCSFLRRSGPSASATHSDQKFKRSCYHGAKGMDMHTSGFPRLVRARAFASLCTVLARAWRQRLAKDLLSDKEADHVCSFLGRWK